MGTQDLPPRGASGKSAVFIPAVGQYDNIGDIILRRQLLSWLRPFATLHIYLGRCPSGYADGLGIQSNDVVYDSFLEWYGAGLKAATRGKISYLFKPGEIQLTLLGMKEHLGMLPLLAWIRLNGGCVARVGAGTRNCAALPRALMLPSLAISQFCRWRDAMTLSCLGTGDVMPDLAFGEGDSVGLENDDQRSALIISMRDDRPPVSQSWLDGVRKFAATNGLDIWVTTQVLRDSPRSAQLAKLLRARLLDWDGSAHSLQEARLRNLYRQSRVAVSDRLHVLIAAYTHGVLPIALLMDDSDKIARHFAVAGIGDICVRAAALDIDEIVAAMEGATANRRMILAGLSRARADLARVREQLTELVASGSQTSTRSGECGLVNFCERNVDESSELSPTAWHVGRQGDLAGGMTQVINAYLRWKFSRFDVRLITSRDGTHSLRSLRIFANAFARISRLQDPDRNILVFHLSQGGAFIREGLLLRLARMRGFGTIAHLHGSRFVEFAQRHPALVGGVLAAATKVIALSEATAEEARRYVPSSSVELVPNAVPPGFPREKEKYIVFGGGVSHRKGVDVLVDAWRAIGDRSGWRLKIAGPIADPDVVPGELLGVDFLGSLPHDSLMELLDRSLIAVLPSRDEAMPMFVLEALARRNCVISTSVGGIPAVLGSGRGILVDPGEQRQLTDALKLAMYDDAQRELIANAGWANFVRNYAAEEVYPRIERIWGEVLSRPKPVRP